MSPASSLRQTSASVDAIFQNFAERARVRMRMIMRMICWVIGGAVEFLLVVGARGHQCALGLTAMKRFFSSVQVLGWLVLDRPQQPPSPDPKALSPSNSLLEGL